MFKNVRNLSIEHVQCLLATNLHKIPHISCISWLLATNLHKMPHISCISWLLATNLHKNPPPCPPGLMVSGLQHVHRQSWPWHYKSGRGHRVLWWASTLHWDLLCGLWMSLNPDSLLNFENKCVPVIIFWCLFTYFRRTLNWEYWKLKLFQIRILQIKIS